MTEITVTNQAELDALPDSFAEFTYIYIKAQRGIIVRKDRGNSSVEAWENSSVVAMENSSVEAWGNSSVVAWENSSVVAMENSSVVAWGNSSVEAWGNSSVEAWENSSVVAMENSSVVAWENSSVVAMENSSVVAWGNSSVEARGNVCVYIQSEFCDVTLLAFAVAYLLVKKAKAKLKSKTATIIKPERAKGTEGWLEAEGVGPKSKVILFKKVSADFKTQEREPQETTWTIGTTLDHPAWNPKESECGSGKFHACSRPYFCDEFRNEKGDKYIAIGIAKKDLYAWPDPLYQHKIAFKKGTVLYECDRFGKEIK